MRAQRFCPNPENGAEPAGRQGAAKTGAQRRRVAKPGAKIGYRLFWRQCLVLSVALGWGALVGCGENRTPSGNSELPATRLAPGGDPSETAGTPETPEAAAVRVRVLRGVTAEIIEGTVPWQTEMTVFDVISRFSPALGVESTGQGESLFVKSIAGQKNLGSAGDNWIYRVNGQLGDRSCAVYPVSAGDEVVWSFGKYE
jgi:hypothetical protein